MLYPKPALAKTLADKPESSKAVWQDLYQISDQTLMNEGRVYGGGLHKLEPKELGNALACEDSWGFPQKERAWVIRLLCRATCRDKLPNHLLFH